MTARTCRLNNKNTMGEVEKFPKKKRLSREAVKEFFNALAALQRELWDQDHIQDDDEESSANDNTHSRRRR